MPLIATYTDLLMNPTRQPESHAITPKPKDAPGESNQLYHPLWDAGEPTPGLDGHLNWAIRLLLLLPGEEDSAIQCDLLVTTIEKSLGSYEALSYVWGEPTVTDIVILGHVPILVTRNLSCALRCLRHKTSARLLWVDALCIDQSSTEEKSTQVPRMWAIFAFSRQTVVFLGDKEDSSDHALNLLHSVSKLGSSDIDTVADMVKDRSLLSSWNSLFRLTQRQWWHRAWIVQEYAVAPKVQFLCGTYILRGEDFTKAIQLLIAYRFKSIVPPEKADLIRQVASTSIHHLWSTRDEYQRGLQPQKQIVGILYKFRGSKSLDPRDKIFSLYKLMGQITELAPDYSQSVQDLYQTVVRTAIEHTGTLQVLSHHNRNVQSQLTLPSWCPDWTVRRGERILLWNNRYKACASEEKARAMVKEGILTLLGVPVADVRVLGRFPVRLFADRKALHDVLHALQEKYLSCSDVDTIKASMLDIFRRTIVASRIRFDGPRGPSTILTEHQADRLWEAWSAQASSGKVEVDNLAKSYHDALYSALCGRALVITNNASVGIVDEPVQDGDQICAFTGGQVLLCIRATNPKACRKTYQLVGECYLHSYMNGEALDPSCRNGASLTEFALE